MFQTFAVNLSAAGIMEEGLIQLVQLNLLNLTLFKVTSMISIQTTNKHLAEVEAEALGLKTLFSQMVLLDRHRQME